MDIMEDLKSVTLTRKEWLDLEGYIAIAIKRATEQAETWEKLSKEKEDDGMPKYKYASSNAKYFRELIAEAESISNKIRS